MMVKEFAEFIQPFRIGYAAFIHVHMIVFLGNDKTGPGSCDPGSDTNRVYRLRSRISFPIISVKASMVMEPRSPLSRERTETVPFSASLSPMVSM